MISMEFRDWVNEKVLSYLSQNRQRVGDKIICRCPLCGDSKKNALKKRGYYYLKTASYYCFNCGESMSGMKLLERLSGEDYQSLKDEYIRMTYDGKHFNQRFIDTTKPKFASNNIFNLKTIVKEEWKHELSENAYQYLANRKVTEAPFIKDKLYTYFDKKNREYILIPWIINGIECYFQLNDFLKHNKTGMKYIFPRNSDKMIYGLDNIDLSWNYIIVMEGVYDTLFLPNAICCGGKNLSQLQLDIIKKRYPKMKICMMFDRDKPGTDAMRKLMDKQDNHFMFFDWSRVPDNGAKDVNDFILKENNVNYFKDKDFVESLIVDPVLLKMRMRQW